MELFDLLKQNYDNKIMVEWKGKTSVVKGDAQ
jgi:hypothetical protein